MAIDQIELFTRAIQSLDEANRLQARTIDAYEPDRAAAEESKARARAEHFERAERARWEGYRVGIASEFFAARALAVGYSDAYEAVRAADELIRALKATR